MMQEMIELKAQQYKVDFLIVEDNLHDALNNGFKSEFPTMYLKAPYMPGSFIKEMERCRPVVLDFKYIHNKGFIHWLSWKLRTLNFGKTASVKIVSSSPCHIIDKGGN